MFAYLEAYSLNASCGYPDNRLSFGISRAQPLSSWSAICSQVRTAIAPTSRAAGWTPERADDLVVSLSLSTFDVHLAYVGCFFGRFSVLPGDNVGCVPSRPMVLRGGWFVLAMMLFRLTQKLCQGRDVQIAESTSGQACCDLLEQPGIAIRWRFRCRGGIRPEPAR